MKTRECDALKAKVGDLERRLTALRDVHKANEEKIRVFESLTA